METIHYASLTTFDAYVRLVMPDCDIFVGHEGAGLWSGKAAQKRGAIYVCDRGCSHMGWKEALLESEYDRVGLKWPGKPMTYNREMDEYEQADLIVVPSTFAYNSFVESGVERSKLAVVPYGVNLDVFGSVERNVDGVFEVLFVGALSVRKGAHDLLDAFKALEYSNKRLTIVGVISNEIRSALGVRLKDQNIRCLGAVSQANLKQIMGRSDVLVLPSIEDGFGMVLVEALACGCPVVATTNTGAPDLITDGIEGFIVPIRSPLILADRLQRLADNLELRHKMAAAALRTANNSGGWQQYGDAMAILYRRLCSYAS
jgi:glycosyltransferase involved in cell wall biosynthesis